MKVIKLEKGQPECPPEWYRVQPRIKWEQIKITFRYMIMWNRVPV